MPHATGLNRRVPSFARVAVAHANSSSLNRAHSFLTGIYATDEDGIDAVDEETESELPLCEAPSCSFSVQHHPRPRPRTTGASQPCAFARNFALFPQHAPHRELPFVTTDLQWHFSVPLDQRARQPPRSIVGQVGARVAQQLVLPRRGRGFVVCGSRSLRGAKKHQTAAGFRVSVASRLTARVPIAGPARPTASFRFGNFAHRAWRLSCGRQKQK